jgi:outer membrane protein TolC
VLRALSSISGPILTVRLEPPVPSAGGNGARRRRRAPRAGRRPDIEARKQIQIGDTNLLLSKNQTLPDLRLQASYVTNALGGSRLLRTGGFPGTIIGTENTSFGTVLGQAFTADFPTWQLGVTLNYPLGKSVEEANLARARLERDPTRGCDAERRGGARRGLRLTESMAHRDGTPWARPGRQRLDAEQKRFEVGMSTSFLVIQAQRDLVVARNNELEASLALQLAVIAFETAQKAGR